ncbi:MAG: FAD-dependent oxidoreductase [Opitutaceae bacterium]
MLLRLRVYSFMMLVAGGASADRLPGAEAALIEADFCVYGGTSGGVVAAVQAARLGRTAVVIEPGRHLGGMTAGGLSWTDVGNSDRVGAVGGMAREVYERIGAHYGQKPGTAFDTPTTAEQVKMGVDYQKPPSLAFEPRVAEQVFNEMAQAAGVTVRKGERLVSVRKSGARVQELVMESGLVVRAAMYLDATYEGDLLARAGVAYTYGREANAQYGETANGIQGPALNPRAGKSQVPVDPYRRRGDPTSGILPYLLREEALGTIGAADRRIQSYNYRVCLTDNPANRIPLERPAGYDPKHYELLARWIEALESAGTTLTLRNFLKYDPLQNRKFDFNNRWFISTDFLGGAEAYPEADPATRARIAQEHERYLRGFFHFLATDERVPVAVRTEMSRFGLPRDEFPDNGGWPHQLYVREARRMVSDFVMTEHYVTGARQAPASIGLGAYGVDMHAVRRLVVQGQPVNEGSNGVHVPKPYPIGYGAIVPKATEAENLLVTFALSASHVAFGSIRMEPVFMTLSQSAATAAVIAIEDRVTVQRVDYTKLRTRLRAAAVVLDWPPDDRPR